MKKAFSLLTRHSSVLASLALVVASLSYGITCSFLFHQPELPKGLEKFAK